MIPRPFGFWTNVGHPPLPQLTPSWPSPGWAISLPAIPPLLLAGLGAPWPVPCPPPTPARPQPPPASPQPHSRGHPWNPQPNPIRNPEAWSGVSNPPEDQPGSTGNPRPPSWPAAAVAPGCRSLPPQTQTPGQTAGFRV